MLRENINAKQRERERHATMSTCYILCKPDHPAMKHLVKVNSVSVFMGNAVFVENVRAYRKPVGIVRKNDAID